MNRHPVFVMLPLTALLAACQAPMARHETGDWAPATPPAAAAVTGTPGSIFRSGHGPQWFLDQRARQVGDTVSVILQERTNASKQAGTSASRSSSIDIPVGTVLGTALAGTAGGRALSSATQLESETDFQGQGASSQSNQLSGSITVTVHEVLANGNLRVRGEKWVTINQGEEFIRLAGTIRPEDINGDNTIPSFKVSDARIIYSGKGVVADANRPGWLTRFFTSIFWPL